MVRASEFLSDALRLTPEDFRRRRGTWFLMHRALVRDADDDVPTQDIGYHTQLSQTPNRAELRAELARLALREYAVAPLRKRPGNPFPERISVGRARNCDIVLRLASVSKLHAHFLLGDGDTLRIADQRSHNGTTVNGVLLDPGAAVVARSGDHVGFGPLGAWIMDAQALRGFVRGRLDPAAAAL